MNYFDLKSATKYMWGNEAVVYDTKVEGIYDTTTARHGGFLVDITLHPELKNYGDKTNIPNIRAFEEDYESLKVYWLYPELINNKEKANEWLNEKTVIRFDEDDSFLKDFPERRVLENDEEEEDELC